MPPRGGARVVGSQTMFILTIRAQVRVPIFLGKGLSIQILGLILGTGKIVTVALLPTLMPDLKPDLRLKKVTLPYVTMLQ